MALLSDSCIEQRPILAARRALQGGCAKWKVFYRKMGEARELLTKGKKDYS